jgi:hypothetical protein
MVMTIPRNCGNHQPYKKVKLLKIILEILRHSNENNRKIKENMQRRKIIRVMQITPFVTGPPHILTTLELSPSTIFSFIRVQDELIK